jgi:hypothetical protein
MTAVAGAFIAAETDKKIPSSGEEGQAKCKQLQRPELQDGMRSVQRDTFRILILQDIFNIARMLQCTTRE